MVEKTGFSIALLCLYVIMVMFLRKLFLSLKYPLPMKVHCFFISVLICLFKMNTEITFFGVLLSMNPRTVFTLTFPLLLLKHGFDLDALIFFRSLPKILLLLFGDIFYMLAIGAIMLMLQDFEMEYKYVVIYGLAIGSFDYIEVVQVMQDIESLRHTLTIYQGESILGTCLCVIALDVSSGIIENDIQMWYQIIVVSLRLILGGILMGLVLGEIFKLIFGVFFQNALDCGVLVIGMCYLFFYLCEYMFSVSGSLAVFGLCMCLSRERPRLPTVMANILRQLWTLYFNLTQQILILYVTVMGIMLLVKHYNGDYILEYMTIFTFCQVFRFILLLVMYPLLSRIGHTFELKDMMTLFWISKKGAYQLLIFYTLYWQDSTHMFAQTAIVHTYLLAILTQFTSGLSANLFLKMFGMGTVSKISILNMNNSMQYITKTRDMFLNSLQFQKMFANADWNVVDRETTLRHPYHLNMDKGEADDDFLLQNRQTFCAHCQKYINIEPTRRELSLISEEAKVRTLKAQKTSFIKQYETGLVSRSVLRIVLAYIDVALETPQIVFKLDDFLSYVNRQIFFKKIKMCLKAFDKTKVSLPPRKPYRRLCYKIIISSYYEITLYVMTIFTTFCHFFGDNSVATRISDAFTIMLIIDFVLKMLAYSHVYYRDAYYFYTSNFWDMFDFYILLLSVVHTLCDNVVDTFIKRADLEAIDAEMMLIIAVNILAYVRYVRLLRFLSFFSRYQNTLIAFCDRVIGSHVSNGYDIASALYMSYCELLHVLPSIIMNENIRNETEAKINSEMYMIQRVIERLEMTMPGVLATCKTKQVARCCLQQMKENVYTMLSNGEIDEFELKKLMQSIDRSMHNIISHRTVPTLDTDVLLQEVGWLCYQDSTYYYINSSLITVGPNETLVTEGFSSNGIYIVVSGFLKLVYKAANAERNMMWGALPIMDYIQDMKFTSTREDYLIAGDSFGLLCYLTDRPYDADIICVQKATLIFIPAYILHRRVLKWSSKSTSMYSVMWKHVTFQLVKHILWNTTVYKNYQPKEIEAVVAKTFVPYLDDHNLFIGTDLIDDIILIEGIVRDIYTEIEYTGPCHLPRSAKMLQLNRINDMGVKPILMLLPVNEKTKDSIYESKIDVDQRIIYDKPWKKKRRPTYNKHEGHKGILKKLKSNSAEEDGDEENREGLEEADERFRKNNE